MLLPLLPRRIEGIAGLTAVRSLLRSGNFELRWDEINSTPLFQTRTPLKILHANTADRSRKLTLIAELMLGESRDGEST